MRRSWLLARPRRVRRRLPIHHHLSGRCWSLHVLPAAQLYDECWSRQRSSHTKCCCAALLPLNVSPLGLRCGFGGGALALRPIQVQAGTIQWTPGTRRPATARKPLASRSGECEVAFRAINPAQLCGVESDRRALQRHLLPLRQPRTGSRRAEGPVRR